MDDASLEAALVGAYARAEAARADALRLLAEVEGRGTWAGDGSRSLACWLTRRVPGMRRSTARLEVRMARLLRDRDVVADALDDGLLSLAAVERLVRAENPRTRACLDRDERVLVGLAGQLDADQYDRALLHWEAMADPQGTAPDDPAGNEVSITPVGGRWRLRGDLDAVGGAALHEAVQAMVGRMWRAEGEEQRAATTASRRRAAALCELVARGAEAPTDRGVVARPATTVVCRLEDLTGGPGAAGSVDLPDGGVVRAATLRRLTCDGSVARVVLGPDSAVLDAGRRLRLPSPAQRRALLVRDGGCAVEHCDGAPWLCEAHHLHHWADGGPTDLANLAMVCRFHHRRAHSTGWTLRRWPDGVVRCLPDGSARTPRSAGSCEADDPVGGGYLRGRDPTMRR